MNYIVIIAIAIIILLGITWIIIDRKRKTSLQAELDNLQTVKNKLKTVDMYLEKLDDISKVEEMRKIYENYEKKRNQLDISIRGYANAVEELEEYNSVFQEKAFSSHLSEIKEQYGSLLYEIKDLESKAKRFSEVGEQNANYNLRLSSNLKSIQHEYDARLKVYEIYDESFNSAIVDAKNKFMQYQEQQTQANFTAARDTLVQIDKIIQGVTTTFTSLSAFYKTIDGLDEVVDSIYVAIKNIEDEGYKLYIKNFDGFMHEFKIREENTLGKMAEVSFTNPDETLIKNISNDIEGLRDDLDAMNANITEQFGYIKELMEIEVDNQMKITTVDDILNRALEEVEAIKIRYNISDSSQMSNLVGFREKFNVFKKDHEKLIEIIHEAKENHDQLIGRANKANLFLNKTLARLKKSVKELEGFRLEELEARELVDNLPKERIELDLYIRRNKHTNRLSQVVKRRINDFDTYYNNLVKELEKEQIDINRVSSLSENLLASYDALIAKKNDGDNEVEIDIKRRIGCYYLIQYISRINKSETRKEIRNLYSYYNLRDYEKCLTNALNILEKVEPARGRDIYKKITSKVIIAPFAPVLLDNNIVDGEE